MGPFIFSHVIFFDRAKSLLAGESSKDEDGAFADGDGVRVSTFVHGGFCYYFVFYSH